MGRGEDGGAALQVLGVTPRLSAAHRDGVDTAAVAVTGAVVSPLPSIPRRPDEQRAPPAPALGLIKENPASPLSY